MFKTREAPTTQVLLTVGLGTALSLAGDASLYAVLPTHTVEAGVAVASVGILLSANRLIRLLLNGPIGLLCDRAPRRTIFVPALFIGSVSTAIYALSQGFWPLLAGRLLWGLAWTGIWVGGNTIILDISQPSTRGRWVGLYQLFFFMGTFSGAVSGGVLTDWLGYHPAMAIGAMLTLLGAVAALLFLPETRSLPAGLRTQELSSVQASDRGAAPIRRAELVTAITLLGVNRLVIAGMLSSTLGLFFLERLGASIEWAGLAIGVATLTGLGLGMNSLISMLAAPLAGNLSDRQGSRWTVISGGLASGLAGFGLLAWGSPLAFFISMPLIAISGGSNQSLATALVGDLTGHHRRGRWLGLMFTVGDLASAIGPLLAYRIMPWLDLAGVYLLSMGIMAVMLLGTIYWSYRRAGK
jgi:MFS family permease